MASEVKVCPGMDGRSMTAALKHWILLTSYFSILKGSKRCKLDASIKIIKLKDFGVGTWMYVLWMLIQQSWPRNKISLSRRF